MKGVGVVLRSVAESCDEVRVWEAREVWDVL